MSKVGIDVNAFPYPMPVGIVGAMVEGRANFMPVGWVSRVNFRPPMIGISLGSHHTNVGIRANGEFSVNVPSRSLLVATDYCGLVSGKNVDKSQVFPVTMGKLEHAPMVADCPLSMECRRVETLKLPSNEVFVGEIVAAYCDEECLTDGRPDVVKMDPFTMTMPDYGYWLVGEYAGRAWSEGKVLKKG